MNAQERIKQILKRSELIRFAIVGTIATAIHYICYYLLCHITTTNISYTSGYIVSLFCNFWLSAKFTFKKRATTRRGIGFGLSHLANYGLQILVLNLCLALGISDLLAPIPVYLICVPVNFLLVRFVFRKI